MSHPLQTVLRWFFPLLIIAPLGIWKLVEILAWLAGSLAE